MRTSFHHLLSQSALARPDAPALTYGDATVNYAQVWRQVRSAAAMLQHLGLRRGDRVAVYLEKRIETVVTIFAASCAGGVFVPINHLLKPAQVAHILSNSGARFLITSGYRYGQLAAVVDNTDVDHVIVIDDARMTTSGSLHSWRAAQAAAGEPSDPGAIDIDPAGILYTSGSTGLPKGVVLSHRNLIVGAESVSSYLENTSSDVILSILPLSFDAGLSQVTTAFAVGAQCVLMNFVLASEVPRLCASHGVTGLTCVPPLWRQLADATWPTTAARKIRYFASTGGRMPLATLDQLRLLFSQANPYLMYGLTEAFRSTYLDPSEVDRRPDSIGKAIPNAEVLVLRPDGTECDPGEDGELVHRGALVALGYWNDPERTSERYRPMHRPGQDWRTAEFAVWSGDTVRRDEEGFLYFVGRRDEMIKTSGHRVSPTELEEAACGTGLVREAVALGVEDEALGQRIVLVGAPVDAEVTAEALTAALRRLLPLYMLPSRVDLRDSLPRSPNGKLDRVAIREQMTM